MERYVHYNHFFQNDLAQLGEYISNVLLLIKSSSFVRCVFVRLMNCIERCLVDVCRKMDPLETILSEIIFVVRSSMRMLSEPRKILTISEIALLLVSFM